MRSFLLQEALGILTTCFTARLENPDDDQATVSSNLLAASFIGNLEVQQFLLLKTLSRKCCQRIAAFHRLSTAQTFV